MVDTLVEVPVTNIDSQNRFEKLIKDRGKGVSICPRCGGSGCVPRGFNLYDFIIGLFTLVFLVLGGITLYTWLSNLGGGF